MATEALSLRQVNSGYGESHILHDVTFTLHAGRILALLGRNGVGKTTCISSIVGFVRPRSGKIQLFGHDIAGLSPERIAHGGIGLVPQGRRIFRSLTVRENLLVASRKARHDAQPWTVERVFSRFPRLLERQAHLAGKLSGGEQQMLAIGRALMSNPRVLLLDEPTEGLAPQIVGELRDFLVSLKAESLSILLVEQNSNMALSVADDVVVLNTSGVCLAEPVANALARRDFLDAQLGVG